MSGVGGIEGIHSLEGVCDLCGEKCDPETQELNALSCTFAPNCPEESALYHQECLERYLKNIRCEKNRKTGFKCPRGCGKGTQYPEPCRGKIDKSHPIHVRNDNAKKRKKAKMPEPAPDAVPRFGPAAKAARAKEREEEKAKLKAQQKAAASAKPMAMAAPKDAKSATSKKESLASAAAAARRELGLGGNSGNGVGKAARPTAPVLRSFEDHMEQRNAKMPPPVQSVWGVSNAAASVATRPAAAPAAAAQALTVLPSVSSVDAFPAVSVATKAAVPQPNPRWGPGSSSGLPSAPSSTASEASTSRLQRGTVPHSTRPGLGPVALAAQTGVSATAGAAEVPKLSKAFRKNMRRAERKREKDAETSVTSEPSPPVTPHQTPGLAAACSPASSPATGPRPPPDTLAEAKAGDSSAAASQPLPQLNLDGDVLDHCLQLVALHKLQQAAMQLQRLGFAPWQAAAAVQLRGCALHPAVQWLLEDHVSSKAEAQQLLLRTALPDVDVTEEAGQLASAAEAPGSSHAAVAQAVTRHDGDVSAALASLGLSNGEAAPRQRAQRLFSPLPSSPLQQQKVPVSQPPRLLAQSQPGSTLDPLLDAILPRELVGTGTPQQQRAAAPGSIAGSSSFGSGLGYGNGGGLASANAALPGFGGSTATSSWMLQQGAANGGLSSAAASNAHSRVSSFDMLSVGNPWGDLLPSSSEHYQDSQQQQQQHQQPAAHRSQPSDGHSSRLQQLPTPFGAPGLPQLSIDTPHSSGRPHGHQQQPSMSSFYGSPASFGNASSALPSSMGLDHYASAMSSQPSWASTSSNLWGLPMGGCAADGINGVSGAGQQGESVPAAALLAAAAVASEAEGDASGAGSGGGMSLGDAELNQLMATLMCR